MKKLNFAALILILATGVVSAQEAFMDQGVTRALVVGISDYQNISDLQFAHRDAQHFADFLKSAAGGHVASDNIRLLLNEKATIAAIADAFDWLYREVKKGDQVYFYFAGHGDVEKQTPWQNGFLLAYNSPLNNYPLRNLPVEELDRFSVAMSLRGARAILLTDACHSGKLAGSEVNGPSLTNEESKRKKANEIRILACQSDQKALENQKWGNGRGVFSYYLIQGLQGLADANQDERVTLEEVETYLKPIILAEAEALNGSRQEPIFDGNSTYLVATVDPQTRANLQSAQPAAAQPAVAMASFAERAPEAPALEEDRLENAFGMFEKNGCLSAIDLAKLQAASSSELIPVFLQEIKQWHTTHPLHAQHTSYLQTFLAMADSLKDSETWRQKFEHRLAVGLHNMGQNMISLYLKGDLIELEERTINNTSKKSYRLYADGMQLAMKLLGPSHLLYHNLQTEALYFTGIDARMRYFNSENSKGLLDSAILVQKQALALDDKSACIHNELGLLFHLKEDYSKARMHLERAQEYAPTWAMPWANLCGLEFSEGNYAAGKIAAETAQKWQSEYFGTYVNLGLIYEAEGNYLMAEELFLKSIALYNTFYLAHERLGIIYLKEGKYAAAETHLQQAEIFKKGFSNDFFDTPRGIMTIGATKPFTPNPGLIQEHFVSESRVDAEYIKSLQGILSVNPADLKTRMELANLFKNHNRIPEAKAEYKTALQYHPDHGPAYAALGLLEWEESALEAAAFNLQRAVDMDLYDREVLDNLANIYHKWAYVDKEITVREKIMKRYPDNRQNFEQLKQVQMENGQYEAAEKNILAWMYAHDKNDLFDLKSFYRILTIKHPFQFVWRQKLIDLVCIENDYDPECTTLLQQNLELAYSPEIAAEIHKKLGLHHFDRNEAIKHFNEAIRLNGRNKSAHLGLIDQLDGAKRFNEALVLLKLLRDSQQIDLLHHKLLANYCVFAGDFKAAQTSLESIANSDPLHHQAENQRIWGVYYLLSKKYDKAAEIFDGLTRKSSNNSDDWYALARAQALKGDRKTAQKSLEQSESLGFDYKLVKKYDPAWNLKN